MNSKRKIEVVQDSERALVVLRDAGRWLNETGKNLAESWNPKNLNLDYLGQYSKPGELYVALVDNQLAAAAVMQTNQNAQDWSSIDAVSSPKAIYIHWLAAHRDFRKQGLPEAMVSFAEKLAREAGASVLRVDTNAGQSKLRAIYERVGFKLVGTTDEGYRITAFYEKKI